MVATYVCVKGHSGVRRSMRVSNNERRDVRVSENRDGGGDRALQGVVH